MHIAKDVNQQECNPIGLEPRAALSDRMECLGWPESDVKGDDLKGELPYSFVLEV